MSIFKAPEPWFLPIYRKPFRACRKCGLHDCNYAGHHVVRKPKRELERIKASVMRETPLQRRRKRLATIARLRELWTKDIVYERATNA